MSVVLCIPGGSVGRSVLCTGWLRLRCRDEARRLRDFRWVVEVSVSFLRCRFRSRCLYLSLHLYLYLYFGSYDGLDSYVRLVAGRGALLDVGLCSLPDYGFCILHGVGLCILPEVDCDALHGFGLCILRGRCRCGLVFEY